MLYSGEKTIAYYVRVSTTDQSHRSQLGDLERHAKLIEGKVEWYRDKASGTSMDRPEWSRLWADVLAGRVQTIVVWRLDRLGRTASGLTQLFDEMKRLRIELVSIKDGLSLSTVAGRMVAGILASIAQFETEVRSERQRAGIEAAKAAGKAFGRPKGSGRAIKVTFEHRELIPRLHAGGSKVASIARATGLSRDTVYAVLNSISSST